MALPPISVQTSAASRSDASVANKWDQGDWVVTYDGGAVKTATAAVSSPYLWLVAGALAAVVYFKAKRRG